MTVCKVPSLQRPRDVKNVRRTGLATATRRTNSASPCLFQDVMRAISVSPGSSRHCVSLVLGIRRKFPTHPRPIPDPSSTHDITRHAYCLFQLAELSMLRLHKGKTWRQPKVRAIGGIAHTPPHGMGDGPWRGSRVSSREGIMRPFPQFPYLRNDAQ